MLFSENRNIRGSNTIHLEHRLMTVFRFIIKTTGSLLIIFLAVVVFLL